MVNNQNSSLNETIAQAEVLDANILRDSPIPTIATLNSIPNRAQSSHIVDAVIISPNAENIIENESSTMSRTTV